ncbi:MAG: membrane protein [Peptococcaceae bacterium BICA1-8]|nr:MAG: membrane protein [Peptococcaceae bacterium BICA1-8]
MGNIELKELARNNLRGNWPTAIIVWLLAWFLTDALTGNGGREAADYVWQNGELIKADNGSNSFGGLVSFIIGGPINFGLAAFFLKLARTEQIAFADLFSGFKYFFNNFILNLLIIIFAFLWFLLLIIPGFIALLKYSMAFYIMHDNPEIRPIEAISKSKEMMDGNKLRLLSLWFSFLGWFILGIFTLGLGFLYAMPYYHAARANFYEDIKWQSSSL